MNFRTGNGYLQLFLSVIFIDTYKDRIFISSISCMASKKLILDMELPFTSTLMQIIIEKTENYFCFYNKTVHFPRKKKVSSNCKFP